jgi:hypothetical protein
MGGADDRERRKGKTTSEQISDDERKRNCQRRAEEKVSQQTQSPMRGLPKAKTNPI